MKRIYRRVRYLAFKIKELFQLASACWNDMIRYARYSHTGFSRDDGRLGQLEGRLMAAGHVIEKGLSMPESRVRFGAASVAVLYDFLVEYQKKGGSCQSPCFQSGLEALEGYIKKHKELGVDIDDIVTLPMRENMARWTSGCSKPKPGVLSFTSETFFAEADSSFSAFHNSRHSCRHFDVSLPVDLALVENAVRIALRTPSGCNRQPWRVYSITNKSILQKCLELHSGSRGFKQLIPALLIISARIDVYAGPDERNQTYTDGGLFCMSLMLALHHQRVGCVPLNWSVRPNLDRQMKAVAGIPESENILMLMGIGHPVKCFTVPQSARRQVDEVLVARL